MYQFVTCPTHAQAPTPLDRVVLDDTSKPTQTNQEKNEIFKPWVMSQTGGR